MDEKRFEPENNRNDESELEYYLNNTAKFQTVNYPQQFNTYDPWAGWNNSSVDMGAKWEEYYAQLEKMKATYNLGTNYHPQYEEPPPAMGPDQLMNTAREGMDPYAPASGEINYVNTVNLHPPVGEETPESLTEGTEAPPTLEEQAIEEEVPEVQTTEEQIIAEQPNDEQTKKLEAEYKESADQGENKELTAVSPQVIVWKNFPPNV